MSDAAATPHSASSNEDTGEHTEPEMRVCEAFNDPAGNVVFKSSDNVIFRVEDYYLKATSGLFRDMLNNSKQSSSTDQPLPLEEESIDLEMMFTIILGRAHEILPRVTNWNQAARLYRLVDNYQIDGHRPWFSLICRAHATEEPWEAIFLACNQSPMDTDMIRTAIAEGFKKHTTAKICDLLYFAKLKTSPEGITCWSTIRPSNITVRFGQKIGLRGLIAYNLTFGNIENALSGEGRGWPAYADDFINQVKKIQDAISKAE